MINFMQIEDVELFAVAFHVRFLPKADVGHNCGTHLLSGEHSPCTAKMHLEICAGQFG